MKKRRIVLLIALIVFLTSIISCIVAYNYNYTYSSKLVAAIEDNDIEKLEDLLKKPGNVNSQPCIFSFEGTKPPISHAAWNYEMVKLLLEYGADPNANGFSNLKPLHWALFGSYKSTDNRFDIAKLLIENGANINAISTNGLTVVEHTFHHIEKDNEIEELAQYEFLLYLIENGVDIYVNTHYMDSNLLFCAALAANVIVCKFLIEEYSFDVNQIAPENYTVLMAAACNRYDNTKAVSYLLELGVDPNIVNYRNETAYDIAFQLKHFEIADLIKSYM
ncbi:MAG: ankyrin repeat domain-containing protein [Acholeplasmatales bacterium]|nr:ankyrin repeat domain-containing protein [Acholeplasmatales bacterium]